MHYVILATHTPDACPTSNAKIRDLLLQGAKEMPGLSQRLGVKMVAGPFVNREHIVVTVVESDRYEPIDQFLTESHLAQWNSIHVLPSLTMEDGLKEISEPKSIF